MSRFTNRSQLPEWYLRAVERSMGAYSKGEAHYSVSELLSPPYQRQLLREVGDQYHEDVDEQTDRLIGHAVHQLLEGGEHGGSIHEERLFLDVDGIIVSGQTDVVEFDQLAVIDGVLWDIKTAKSFAVKMFEEGRKDDWLWQTNIYAEMWRQVEGANISAIKLLVVVKDWSWREAERSPQYPQTNPCVLDIPMRTGDEVMGYIRERIRLHEQAKELTSSGLDPCNPTERWRKESDHAVYGLTKGERNKRATRVFPCGNDTESAGRAFHEATVHAAELEKKAKGKKQYEVVFRPGEDVRCRPRFCKVAPACRYWQSKQVIE